MPGTPHENGWNHIRIAALRSHGDAPTDLREHVEAQAARLSGRFSDHAEILPPGVRELVDTVARHAYKVTDHDIEHLRHEGYSENAIFELLVCTAVGAGSARFERAMHAIREDADAAEGR